MAMGFCENFIPFFGNRKYTLCVSPNLSEEDFTALGRLITHMFIQCGTFPVKLVKASMYQALFGAVSDEIVLDSFLRLLPLAETQILSDVLNGKKALSLVLDEVLDILDEYQERTRPTSTNLKATLVKDRESRIRNKTFPTPFKDKGRNGEVLGFRNQGGSGFCVRAV